MPKKIKVAPAEATFVPTDNLEAVEQIVRESVLSLWDVVDNLTRLRPERSRFYHVTIFGSARIRPRSDEYKDVRKLAENLARMGCRIVTGGGPGLMQAANEGAADAHPDKPETSIGLRIDLEHEQEVNAFVGQAYRHRTFFSRLHHFVLLSNAFVVMPGGIGTTLELAMVWQLLQVRKLYGTPLILVGEMWEKLVTWAREYMVEGAFELADPIDMTIPDCVPDMDAAIELIRRDHAKWNGAGAKGRPKKRKLL